MICERCNKQIRMAVAPSVIRALGYCEMPLSMLRLRTKEKPLPEARWKFWFWLVVVEGRSLTETGRVTKHHHTTVLNGVRQHANEVLGTPMSASIESIIEAHSQAAVENWNKAERVDAA